MQSLDSPDRLTNAESRKGEGIPGQRVHRLEIRLERTSSVEDREQMFAAANCDFTGCPKHSIPGGMRGPKTAEKRVTVQPARKRAGQERGASFVEFTLIMPVLLLVATGMTAFGVALHNDLVLTNAVNGGAQLVSFSRGQTTDPCATAYTAISNAAPGLTSGLSLTYVIDGSTYTTNSCPAGAANMVQGATLQVTGSYPYSLVIVGEELGTHSFKAQVSEVIQ